MQTIPKPAIARSLVTLAFVSALFTACSPKSAPAPAPPATGSAAATSSASALASAAPASASGSATPSAIASAEPPSTDAGVAKPIAETFCTDAYGGPLEALRIKCTDLDFAIRERTAHTAQKMCIKDFETLAQSGRSSIDESASARCVQWAKHSPDHPDHNAESKLADGESLFSHPPCDRVVRGKQSEGEPCRSPLECKEGLACTGFHGTTEGACAKPGPIGAKCSTQKFGALFSEAALAQHHPACAKGAMCANGVCASRVAPGAACADAKMCLEGDVCYMGKCSHGGRAAIGGACAKSPDCAPALFCDEPAGKCAARKPAGDACTGDQCKGTCDTPRGARAGKCASSCGSG